LLFSEVSQQKTAKLFGGFETSAINNGSYKIKDIAKHKSLPGIWSKKSS
jgi:hypothetical protein